MIQQFRDFIDEFFLAVWCAGFAIALVVYAAMTWWYVSHGPSFPHISTVNVLHRERFASGRSHLSLITRFGWAHNALVVTLTDTELWLKTPLVFWGVAAFYDQIHRIRLTDIDRVEQARRSVFVHFTRNDSTPGKFELRLRDKAGFLSKIAPFVESR